MKDARARSGSPGWARAGHAWFCTCPLGVLLGVLVGCSGPESNGTGPFIPSTAGDPNSGLAGASASQSGTGGGTATAGAGGALGGTAGGPSAGSSTGGFATESTAGAAAMPVGDAGLDGSAGPVGSPCTTAGSELCEDFESGAIDSEKWNVVTTQDAASATVDGEHVHSGSFALHVHVTPGDQTTAQIDETVTFPAADDTVYARMFAYFAQELPSDPGGGYHMGFIQTVGHNDLGEVRSSVGSIADRQVLGDSIYFGPPFYEFGPWSETRYDAGQWYCIELYTSGSGGLNTERRIWIDDVEMENQHTNYDGQKAPEFEHLSFGIWQYHPTPNLADVWIDDIRVSATRIGCQE